MFLRLDLTQIVSLAEFVEELHFQVENLGKAADEILQGPFLLALVWIRLLFLKKPQPGDTTESQGKINAFTANLHPLMLFPAIYLKTIL